MDTNERIPAEISRRLREIKAPQGAQRLGPWEPFQGIYARKFELPGWQMTNPQQSCVTVDGIQDSNGNVRLAIGFKRVDKLQIRDAKELAKHLPEVIQSTCAYHERYYAK